MSLFTSSQFASAAATGTDWRDTSKAVLEKLEDVRTDDFDFNFGFLYISDHLAEDAGSILNLFKSVLNIEHWVGGVGVALCGNGEAFVDRPAISAMIGHFEEGYFQIFPSVTTDISEAETALSPWLEKNDPMLVLTHGDALAECDMNVVLQDIESLTGGFLVGGLTSSRHKQVQFAGDDLSSGVSGVVFSSEVPVASMLSQGCHEIGGIHTITRCDEQTILELDGEKAASVFEDDLRAMAIKKIDRDPDEILVDEGDIPEEFQSLFKGEVHAAFPVSGSDQKDYLVRHITGFDADEGSMQVAKHVQVGDRILFVKRDETSVIEDLSQQLVSLRERVSKDYGGFEPKGGIYISCVARASGGMDDPSQGEMALIREIIGDIPLCGFYAGGEINKARLYGYTGILVLFL